MPPAFLLPAFIIGIWGCLLARLFVSGDLINLQAPKFHLLTLGAAGVCLLLALAAPLLFQPRTLGVSPGRWLTLLGQSLILLLPAAAYLMQGPVFATPAALLDRAWSLASARHATGLPRTARPNPAAVKKRLAAADPAVPFSVSMLDLFAIESDPQLRDAFTDRSIELLGQFLPAEDERFRLVRLLMICCAADARPIGLVVEGPSPDVEPGAWALAIGRLDFNDPSERVILRAVQTAPTSAPPDIFLR